MSNYTLKEITGKLRFIERDDKRILQQLWQITEHDIIDAQLSAVKQTHEWIDVPLEEEK